MNPQQKPISQTQTPNINTNAKNISELPDFAAYRAGYEDAMKKTTIPQKSEKRRQGFKKPIGCRRLISIIFYTFLALLVLTIYTVIVKPPVLWSPMVNFLNNKAEFSKEPNNQTFQDAQNNINNQITTVGTQDIYVSEEDLEVLLKSSLNREEVFVEIQNEKMLFYWVMDSTIPENPLYGVAEITAQNLDNLTINRVGTNRIYIPSQFSGIATNLAKSALEFGTNVVSSNTIYDLLKFNNSFKVDNIRFEENTMILTIDVNVRLIP